MTTQEGIRKLVHIFSLMFAFTFRFIPASWAFLLGMTAFIHNILLLPKYAPTIFREKEHLMQGVGIYPLMVAILVLLFPDQLMLAGGAWAILAWGDGFSSLVGRIWRLAPMPWNPSKSLGGTLMFFLMGTFAAFVVICWIGPIYTLKHVLLVAMLSTLIASIYETLPLPWDDNIVVSLVAAAFLSMLWPVDVQLSSESISAGWWGLSLLINIGIAGLVWYMEMISTTGALSGTLIGTTILAMGTGGLYSLLVIFFLLATLATKVGYHEKEVWGVAQENRGKRRARHTLANGILALMAVVLYGCTNGIEAHLLIFYCAALATALGDTVSSELGQVYGRQPFMPTTFRLVPVGTVGAVSIEGTLCGMGATILFTFIALLLSDITIQMAPVVILGSWIGFFAESYIGGYWTEEGVEVSNEWMNVLNTFIGGTLALVFGHLTGVV